MFLKLLKVYKKKIIIGLYNLWLIIKLNQIKKKCKKVKNKKREKQYIII